MNDTIAAIATAQGVGAISIIRVSGEEAINIVSNVFSNKNFKDADSHTIHYGFIMENGEKIDEVLVSKMCAPKTFTREDVVEINTHGGISTTNKVLEVLLSNGCRLAEPGEFSKRAFLNGRIDLTEAEGIIDLINAKTEKAHKMAINQVGGKASLLIKDLRNDLSQILANIEVNLNYPEYDDIEDITVSKIKDSMKNLDLKINKIISESKNGELLKSGINTVILGRPNVGKSSLLNNLIGEEKAIVTEIQGTTRDSVEATLIVDNIILNLIDTAGVRKTDDIVESIGVEKSLKLAESADLVLLVLDYNQKLTDDDKQLIESLKGKNYITIINKCDLEKKIDDELLLNKVYVSAAESINMEGIALKIKELFNLEKLETDDMNYLGGARSLSILNQVGDSVKEVNKGIELGFSLDMIEIDLKKIWSLLGEIIGESYEEELIDELFSRFCVGK
ncbi:MAG: tRNA uridine-5-carboxymethylaminomethyl(34) synthesis GTPase MnmE [Bacilli bacterium]|nr:tRNA uridine-5-carboxymethylaminomethyl(34) synthesis GTPase MnmE [Bacilli bacterium]